MKLFAFGSRKIDGLISELSSKPKKNNANNQRWGQPPGGYMLFTQKKSRDI